VAVTIQHHSLPAAFDRLEVLRSRYDVLDQVNPVNVDAVKEAFLTRGEVLPLEYAPKPVDLADTRAELLALDFGDHPGASLYSLARQGALAALELIELAGQDGFAERCLRHNQPPLASEVLEATSVLQSEDRVAGVARDLVSAESVLEVLKSALDGLGVPGWSACFGATLSRCRVVSSRRTVELNPTAKFRAGDAHRLVVHEVYGHVLRFANGANQPLPILAFGLPDYLATEEGITGFLERTWGLKADGVGGAKHVIATHAALQGGFQETFDAVRRFCTSDELAFRLALRAKRGLRDTNQPGAYLKDLAYWRGERELEGYFAAGGALASLFVGKVGVHHLALLEPLRAEGWILPPVWLPPLPAPA
jgi:hypothetical protein